MKCNVIIPTRINTLDLYPLLGTLINDESVNRILVVCHGDECFQRINSKKFEKVETLYAPLDWGIHNMWNMAMDELRGSGLHLGIINDDITLSKDASSVVCSMLDSDNRLGLVSPSGNAKFTGKFAKGTLFAGFCFYLAKDLVDEWRFDIRLRWHCGDDDVNQWISRVKQRLVGITGLAHALNNRSYTITTSTPENFEDDIKSDRRIFKEKVESFYALFPPNQTVP